MLQLTGFLLVGRVQWQYMTKIKHRKIKKQNNRWKNFQVLYESIESKYFKCVGYSNSIEITEDNLHNVSLTLVLIQGRGPEVETYTNLNHLSRIFFIITLRVKLNPNISTSLDLDLCADVHDFTLKPYNSDNYRHHPGWVSLQLSLIANAADSVFAYILKSSSYSYV